MSVTNPPVSSPTVRVLARASYRLQGHLCYCTRFLLVWLPTVYGDHHCSLSLSLYHIKRAICPRASLGVRHILAIGPFPYTHHLLLPPLAISHYTCTSRDVCISAQLTGQVVISDAYLHRISDPLTGPVTSSTQGAEMNMAYSWRVPIDHSHRAVSSPYMAPCHVQKDLCKNTLHAV
jgi:hypothetical protein